MNDIANLFTLCWEFFKAGLFAVGGGLATLPFLHDMARRFPWFTETELGDMIAVAESTPGPIGVNMATFAGYRAEGILGGVAATLALVLPSFIVIIIVSRFLKRFRESRAVSYAFDGLRPCVTALVLAAGWSVFRVSVLTPDAFAATGSLADLFSPAAACLFAAIFILSRVWKKAPPIALIAIGAAAGILLRL